MKFPSPAVNRPAFACLRQAASAWALLAVATSTTWGQVMPAPEPPVPAEEVDKHEWLDHTQEQFHRLVWRSAMWLDGIAAPPLEPEAYQAASGSIALAMMWSEFDGVEPRVRFRVDLPLPRINQRLHAFVGRVSRDEYVTERDEPSGAFPQYRNDMDDDQTLAGIFYSEPEREGYGRFSAGVGARLRSSELDPYVKAAYQFQRLLGSDLLLRIKETVFWQTSERWGLTSRVDLERIINDHWHVRWSGSGTISEGSAGVRGYSTLTVTRALPGRQAVIVRVGLEGETEAPVPLEEFGLKVAYRRSVLRDWLVLELRTSLMWPKELPEQPRKPSWGFGVGCEMFFGDEPYFSTQPVTF